MIQTIIKAITDKTNILAVFDLISPEELSIQHQQIVVYSKFRGCSSMGYCSSVYNIDILIEVWAEDKSPYNDTRSLTQNIDNTMSYHVLKEYACDCQNVMNICSCGYWHPRYENICNKKYIIYSQNFNISFI